MFVITINAKMLITDPIIIKSIKPKPMEPTFSDFNNFCMVKLHHIIKRAQYIFGFFQ